MHRQGIYFTARVRGPEDLTILPGRSGSRWRGAIYGLRERLLTNLDQLFSERTGTADEGAILRAMLLGDDNWLSPRVETAFQASGTYHVLVVSGWNVFAFAIPLLWLVTRLRLPDWLGNSLVALAVVLFALLAEGHASVARAALMFLIYLGARYLYRERAVLNSIAAAALILLVIHPSDLRDAGFQLSFFAVLVLAAIAAPLINWVAAPYRRALDHLEDRQRDLLLEPAQIQLRDDCRVLLDSLCGPASDNPGRRRLRSALAWAAYGALWLVEGILFAALIQVGLVLVSVSYFHRLTWSGIFANFAILPLASGIVLIGLPLLFVSTLWWRAAAWGAVLLGWATDLLEWIAQHAARWQILNRRVPAPPGWLVVLFLVVLAAFAVLLGRRSRWSWAAAAALAALCITISLAPYSAQLSPGRLELNVLDVGEGDSLFVSFPSGATMLVDGGGEIPIPGSPPPRLDVGESVISSYLWSRKIQKLDYVVLTHDHSDHMGGLEAVLNNFRVGELWLGTDPGDRNMNWLRDIAARRGTRNVHVAAGIRKTVDGVAIEVLLPPVDWAPKRVSNNDSIVLRLGYQGRHYLLTGDVEARMERLLTKSDDPLASEVLKVAHHGSRTSSTAAFLARVAPQFGIVSVGAFKRFGLPNQEALDRLAAAGVRVYRTDLDGTTTVSTDGYHLDVTSFRESLRPWPRFASGE
jgi:competence protein ComEC